MSAFHGNFFVRSTDLLSLAAVPLDQSYAIEIQIEDPITAPFVVFQTAVLHTTCFGERRIRVLTLALPTTSSISELYGSVDTVAMATLLVDKAVERSMQSKLEDARDAVVNKLVDVLGTYKATMTSSGSGASPQLVISENMKFLPLLLLGLLKHVSFCRSLELQNLADELVRVQVGLRQSSVIPSDLRAYAQALLTTLPSQLLLPYLHPVFYSLHNMPKEVRSLPPPSLPSLTNPSFAVRYYRRARRHPPRPRAPFQRAARAPRPVPDRGRAEHLPLDRARRRSSARDGRL